MKKYIKPTARVIITESVILAGSTIDVNTDVEVNEQYSKDSGIWHWMDEE